MSNGNDYSSDEDQTLSHLNVQNSLNPDDNDPGGMKKRVGGRQVGATNYSKEEISCKFFLYYYFINNFLIIFFVGLLDIVEQIRPSHPSHWDTISKEYNNKNPNNARSGENLHKKFVGLVKKVRGGAANSYETEKAKRLYFNMKTSQNDPEPFQHTSYYPTPSHIRPMEQVNQLNAPDAATTSLMFQQILSRLDDTVTRNDLSFQNDLLRSISDDIKAVLNELTKFNSYFAQNEALSHNNHNHGHDDRHDTHHHDRHHDILGSDLMDEPRHKIPRND